MLFFALPSLTNAQQQKKESKFLGEEPPGLIPKKFAPTTISLPDRYEFGSTFSEDGKEFFFATETFRKPEILWARYENHSWTAPALLMSHEQYGYNDPFLSPDGKRLFFISDRPLKGSGEKKDIDIWYIERTNSGWSEPVNAGREINTDKNEYYISFTENGRIYFSSNGGTTANSEKNYDIKTSNFKDGKFQSSQPLGSAINSEHYEADVFVSPDETYIIYCSERPNGNGQGDLYISFKDKQGGWRPAKNLGAPVNTAGYEFCPFVTSDNKFLFFSRDGDIYWVSTALLEKLR